MEASALENKDTYRSYRMLQGKIEEEDIQMLQTAVFEYVQTVESVNEALVSACKIKRAKAAIGTGDGNLLVVSADENGHMARECIKICDAAIHTTERIGKDRVVMGSSDANAYVYSLGIGEVATLKKHVGSISACKTQSSNDNVFFTGGRDGQIVTWDLRMKHPVLAHRVRQSTISSTVTGIEVLEETGPLLVSTHTPDRNVYYWDTRWTVRGNFKMAFRSEHASCIASLVYMRQRKTFGVLERNGYFREMSRYFKKHYACTKTSSEAKFISKLDFVERTNNVAIGGYDGVLKVLSFTGGNKFDIQTLSHRHGGSLTNGCFVTMDVLLSFGDDGVLYSYKRKN